MRSSVYTFLLTTCLLLTPCAFLHAGTDDSGLQVFELDVTKMKGFSADVMTEDSFYAQECKNLYANGYGLTSLFQYASDDIFTYGSTTAVSTLRFVDWSKTSSYFLNAFYKDGSYYVTRTADNNIVIPAASADNSFIFGASFFYGTFQEIVVSKKAVYTVNGVQVTGLPFFPTYDLRSATLWKNRLWVLAGTGVQYYRLWHSQASNYTNFTSSATEGGVLNLADFPDCVRLVGTNYGLYIIAREGIWLISGGDTPTSWRVEKIIAWKNDLAHGGVCEYQGQLFLTCDKGIFLLSGTSLEKLTELPKQINVASTSIIHDRFLGITASTDTTPNAYHYYSTSTSETYLYDLQSKSFITAYPVHGVFNNDLWVKFSSALAYTVYQAPPLIYSATNTNTMMPILYHSPWLTLDGNGANSKIVKRIEIESIGNNPTMEVALYAELANNTLLGSANSYKDFNTSIPLTSLATPTAGRPATNTFIWNVAERQPFRKIAIRFQSLDGATMTGNFLLKKIRVYYVPVGNPLKNSLR